MPHVPTWNEVLPAPEPAPGYRNRILLKTKMRLAERDALNNLRRIEDRYEDYMPEEGRWPVQQWSEWEKAA